MVELGKYAGAVLGSWAVTISLFVVLILVTWRQSVVARRALEAAEARHRQAKNTSGEGA